MPIEAATYISQLNSSYPLGTDDRSTTDDHLRLIKAVLQAQFPSLGAAAVNATAAELNALAGLSAVIDTFLGAANEAAARAAIVAMQDVITTRGDLVRGNSSGDPERLALAAYGSVLSSDGTDAIWMPGQTGFRNKVIGGDFTVNPWQRGTGFAPLASGAFGADRFGVSHYHDGAVSVFKTADAPTPAQANLFTQHCLHFAVTTADAAIGAEQYYVVYQNIEGYNAASFGFGQAGTRYVTLSFWVKSSLTGVHCVSITNSAGSRSYVAEYTVSVADTWEKKTITIPVDTSGTWLYDSGIGLQVRFALAAGSTYQTTASTWAAGNFLATSSQVNLLGSTAYNFKIALVQLEAGSVATPFETRPIGIEQSLCKRYYQTIGGSPNNFGVQGYTTAGNNVGHTVTFPEMRSVPTIVLPTMTNTNTAGLVVSNPSTSVLYMYATATATGYVASLNAGGGLVTMNAEL